ncbi:MAG: transporter [Sedimentisphaerales bacterium]|nr:transporter [Sedimentisphaerales bacterium]
MKCKHVLWATLAVLTVVSAFAWAQETGHYPLGVEGLKAGTLPPPGLYSRNYLLYYNANVFRDRSGNNAGLGADIDALVFAPRLIWITNQQILGADYGMDALLPIPYQDVELNRIGLKDNDFCYGDICVEPIDLAWHGERWDLGAAYALWMPTGKYNRPRAGANHLANPGKDFWTNMFTFGGTYYLDEEKTLHASALGRYEIHSRKDHTDVKPGQNILVEWGVGKTLAKIWDVGVIGYAQWQLTDDKGSDVADAIQGIHDRVAAIGPEVSVFVPPIKSILSVRAAWEFSAVDRPEGTTVVFTFTKIF